MRKMGRPVAEWVVSFSEEKNLTQYYTYEDLVDYSGVQRASIAGFFSRNKIVGEPFRGQNNRLQMRFRTQNLKQAFKKIIEN